MIEDIQLRVTPETAGNPELLRKAIQDNVRNKGSVNDYRIVRRSIDARKRQVVINLTVRVAMGDDKEVKAPYTPVTFRPVASDAKTMVIIGAGPAGLFCAYILSLKGFAPIVIERGSRVDKRKRDVENFWNTGILVPDSNVQFGEGSFLEEWRTRSTDQRFLRRGRSRNIFRWKA